MDIGDKKLVNIPYAVSYLLDNDEKQDEKIDNLASRLAAAIAGVLHYKGSVATYADLPADAEIGDVYNVLDTGANYAWTGSEWDELGMTVDLSNYYAKNANLIPSADNVYYLGDSSKIFKGAFLEKLYFGGGAVNIAKQGNRLTFGGAMEYNFGASIVPLTSGQNDLGNASLQFRDLYLSRALKIAGGIFSIAALGTMNLAINANWIPELTATYDLGGGNYRWKNIYLSGSLRDGNNANYGYALPDSTSLTANSELLDTVSEQTVSGKKIFTYNNSVYFGTTRIFQDGTSIKFGSRLQVSTLFPINDRLNDLGDGIGWYWRDLWLSRNIVTVDSNDTQQTISMQDLLNLIAYAKAQGWIS